MKDNPMLKDIRIGRKNLKHLNRQGLISPPKSQKNYVGKKIYLVVVLKYTENV